MNSALKKELKTSGTLIGWYLKDRIIFEKCAFFGGYCTILIRNYVAMPMFLFRMCLAMNCPTFMIEVANSNGFDIKH
jgi:hypothetical protein